MLDSDMLLCFYMVMRTTIDLPDDVFRRVKAEAALRQKSLKELITEAIEHEIGGDLSAREKRVEFPLVRSKRPGSVDPDFDTLAELLDAEDAHVPPRR